MKHYTIAVLVFVFTLVTSIPSSVYADHDEPTKRQAGSSQTTSIEARLEALTKMIEDLKKRLEELKKGNVGSGGPRGDSHATSTNNGPRPNACDRIPGGNFGKGRSGEDVRSLQDFLREEGRLSKDSVTGYFGGTTEEALKGWQRTHGVVDDRDTNAGHFGQKTRDAIKKRCAGGGGTTATSTTFMLTPKEGDAPLTVTISGVPAAVQKKINECKYSFGYYGRSGNGLTVDWGDGHTSPSDTSTSTGASCSNDVRKHTYTTAGTYTVKVRSWHPGPTDAPVTDWEGTAKVTVKAKPTKATSTALLRVTAAKKARTALAEELDVRTTSVSITAVESKEWSDGCLGLGGAAESCLAAITPGYRVTMKHSTTTYYARTNKSGSVVRLEQ